MRGLSTNFWKPQEMDQSTPKWVASNFSNVAALPIFNFPLSFAKKFM